MPDLTDLDIEQALQAAAAPATQLSDGDIEAALRSAGDADLGEGLLGSLQRGVKAAQTIAPTALAIGATKAAEAQAATPPTLRMQRRAFEEAMSDPGYQGSLAGDDAGANLLTEVRSGPSKKLEAMRQPLKDTREFWAGVTADMNAERAALPRTAAQKELGAAKTSGEKWAAWLKNPVELTASIVLESLPSSLAGGLLGTLALGPGYGTAAGVGLSSFAQTASSELMGEASNRGYDINDPLSLGKFLSTEKDWKPALDTAITKAAVVGGVDAVTAKLAGRFIGPALQQGLRQVVVGSAKELGMQALGGAAGEAGGQALSGQPLDTFDIAMEALAEVATGPMEAVSNIRESLTTKGKPNAIRTEQQQERLQEEPGRIPQGQNLPQDSGQVRESPGGEAGSSGGLLSPAQEPGPAQGVLSERLSPTDDLTVKSATPVASTDVTRVKKTTNDQGNTVYAISYTSDGVDFLGYSDNPIWELHPNYEAAQAPQQSRPVSETDAPPVPAPAPAGTPTVAQSEGTFTVTPPGQRGRQLPTAAPAPPSVFSGTTPPGLRGRGVPVGQGQIRRQLAVPPGQRGRGIPQTPAPVPLAVPPGERGRQLPTNPQSAFTETTPPGERGRGFQGMVTKLASLMTTDRKLLAEFADLQRLFDQQSPALQQSVFDGTANDAKSRRYRELRQLLGLAWPDTNLSARRPWLIALSQREPGPWLLDFRGAKTALEAFDAVIAWAGTQPDNPVAAGYLALAKLLRPLVERSGMGFTLRPWTDADSPDAAAYYDAATRSMVLFSDRQHNPLNLSRNVLHEAIHGLTLGTLKAWLAQYAPAEARKFLGQEAVKAVASIPLSPQERAAAAAIYQNYIEAKSYLQAMGADLDYGLTTPVEYVTEALTNPEFQALLAQIPVKENPALSLWDKFKAIIAKAVQFLLGPVTSIDQTLLERSINDALELSHLFDARQAERLARIATRFQPKNPASINTALETLRQAYEAGDQEDLGEAKANVRREEAGEVVGQNPTVQEAVHQLLDLYAQRNRRGDVRLSGEALQRMRVIQGVVQNKWVKRHLVNPVLDLEQAAREMEEAYHNYDGIKRDPLSTPELKSAAAGLASRKLDALHTSVAAMQASYEERRNKMVQHLEELNEARSEVDSHKETLDVLLSDFHDIARTMVAQARDSAVTRAYRRALGSTAAVRNTLGFVARYVDLNPVGDTMTTTAEVRDHILAAAAPHARGDTTVEQVVGASRQVVEDVALYLLRSQPLRARLREGKIYLDQKATRVPLSRFKSALAMEIRAGNIGAALRLFVDGVGKTAAERAKLAETARFFKDKEQKALIDIQVLDEVMAMAKGLVEDPAMKERAREVYGDLNVRQVVRNVDDFAHTLPAVGEVGEATISLGSDAASNVENVRKAQEWMAAAQAYAADTEAEGYDPRFAAGLQAEIQQLQHIVDPSINPVAERLMEGAPRKIIRKFFDVLAFGVDAIPEFVLDQVAGTVGEWANASVQALDTVKEQVSALLLHWGPRINRSLKAALKSHAENGAMTLDQYRDYIYGPMAASYQDFENVSRYRAGDPIGNGYTVTRQDLDHFAEVRALEAATIKAVTATAEDSFESIRQRPSGILYEAGGKKYIRLPFHHGPGTVHRRFSPRLFGAGGWVQRWRAAGREGRIRLLDENVNRLLFGYLRGATENTLKFTYKYGQALKSIYAMARGGAPVRSFEDLAERVHDYLLQHPTGDEEPTRDQVEGQILSEIDDLFKRFEKMAQSQRESDTTIAHIFGGRTPFHYERGQQVVPALWYDYGSVGDFERMGYMKDATTWFWVEHWKATEALLGSLSALRQKMQDQGGPRQRASRGEQLSGQEYYNWNQLKMLERRVAQYRNNLNAIIAQTNQAPERGGALTPSGHTWMDYVVGSLLAMIPPQLMNSFGGAWMVSVMDRMHRGTNMATSMARGGVAMTKAATRALVHALSSEKTTHGSVVQSILKDPSLNHWLGEWPGALMEWMNKSNDLYRHNQRLGLNQNVDLINTVASQLAFARYGGVAGGDRAETMLEKVRAIGAAGLRVAGTGLRQGSVGFVDSIVNAAAAELSRDMEQDLMNRAAEFGKLREERARAGGWNPEDQSDLRNRWTTEELVGGRISRGQAAAAVRLRQLFLRKVGVNLDEVMHSFYQRLRARGLDPDSPEFSIPDDLKLLTPEQRNQLALAVSEATNQASFLTRPTAAKANRFVQLLSVFMGYPAMAMYRLASAADNIANRPWSKQQLERLPMVMGIFITAAIVGSAVAAMQDRVKRKLLNRPSPWPTILDKQEPGEYVKTLLSGAAALIPFYGTLLQGALGRAYRTGFDANSLFVVLNLATDMQRAFKKVMATGDGWAELARPPVQFASRYLFPFTWMGPHLPLVSGLTEQRAVENLLSRGARGTGLEMRVRQGGGGGDVVYTPMSGKLDTYWNAIGNRDAPAAAAAWQEMLKLRMKEGDPDPASSVARAVASRSPLNRVFTEPPTRAEFGRILGNLSEEDQQQVLQFMNYSDAVTTGLGGGQMRFGGESSAGVGAAKEAAPVKVSVPPARSGAGGGGGVRRAAAINAGPRAAVSHASYRVPRVSIPAAPRARRPTGGRLPRPRAGVMRNRVGGLRRLRR